MIGLRSALRPVVLYTYAYLLEFLLDRRAFDTALHQRSKTLDEIILLGMALRPFYYLSLLDGSV